MRVADNTQQVYHLNSGADYKVRMHIILYIFGVAAAIGRLQLRLKKETQDVHLAKHNNTGTN